MLGYSTNYRSIVSFYELTKEIINGKYDDNNKYSVGYAIIFNEQMIKIAK